MFSNDRLRTLLLVFIVCCQATLSLGSDVPPVTRAVRLAIQPTLDGNVISDPAWKAVAETSGFWQTMPDEGQPSSERTSVYVGYSDNVLYIAAVLHDRDPGSIIFADARRDSSLDDTDSFRFVIDTFLNQQTCFLFGTNPANR